MAVLRYQGGSVLAPTSEPAEIFSPDYALQQFCNRGFSYDYALELRNATFLYAPQNEAVEKLMENVMKANDYFLEKANSGDCPQFVKEKSSKKELKTKEDQMPLLGELILIFWFVEQKKFNLVRTVQVSKPSFENETVFDKLSYLEIVYRKTNWSGL